VCDGARLICNVHQHRVGAEFHRERRVGSRAHPGVNDHRHPRELADDPEIVGVLNPQP